MTILIYEVNTVERVERRYVVQIDTDKLEDLDDGDWTVRAEEAVRCGEQHKFTEGNAEIEEVLSVRLQD